MSTTDGSATALRRRCGRRAGIVGFTLVVSAFTLVCTVQILHQVFFAPVRDTAAKPTGPEACTHAVSGLRSAVRRARTTVLGSSLDEAAALQSFRAALAPEWQARAELDRLCNSQQSRDALKLLDELRYTEEHAVRYEASRLHTVNEDVERLLGPEQH